MSTFTNTAREVEMPNGDVVVIHNAPTGGENTTSNIKKFKYDDNGHVTDSTAADAEDLNLSGYSTPTTGSTDIGTSDDVQTAIGKLDHQSHIDQTNILSVSNGVKLLTKYGGGINKLRYNNSTETVGEATFTINDDKSISIYTNGATTTARALVLVRATDNINVDATDIVSGLNSYSGNGIYFGWGIGSSGGDRVLYPNEVQEAIGTSGVMRYFAVYVGSGVNIPQQNAFTVNPMIVSAQDYANLSGYQPYALPNYDLTVREAEDRAALAEQVDEGAKNKFDFANITYNSSTNCTYTKTDDSITVTSQNVADGSRVTYTFDLEAGSYVFRAKITNLTIASVTTLIRVLDGSGNILGGSPVSKNGIVYFPFRATTTGTYKIMYAPNWSSATFVNTFTASENMICTEADWKISQNFAPYALPNTDLTVLETEDRAALVEVVDEGAKNRFNFDAWKSVGVYRGSKTVSGNSVTITSSQNDAFTYVDIANGYPQDALIYVSTGDKLIFTWDYTNSNSQATDEVMICGNGAYTSYVHVLASAKYLEYTVPSGITYITIRLGVATSGDSATYSNMMICSVSEYSISDKYEPYALPNYDLTRLEQQDRNALVEVVDEGAKNIFDLHYESDFTSLSKEGLTATLLPDGTISVTGTPTTTEGGRTFIIAQYTASYLRKFNGYYMSGSVAPSGNVTETEVVFELGGSPYTRFAVSTNGNLSSLNFPNTSDLVYFYIRIYCANTTTAVNLTFKPMIATKVKLDVSRNYAPFALPNSDLTQLEAEDRAALAEVVDSGAKNKLSLDKDAIKSLNSGGTWSGYVYTPTTAPNLTVTINDDGTVTLNGSTSSSLVTVALERKASSGFQGYVLSGSKANTKLVYQLAVSPYTVYATADGVGSDVIANYTDGSTIQLSLQVVANSTFSNTVITPMICTEAEWKVSQNYEPYALPNTDLTVLEAEDRAALAEEIDAGAKNLFNFTDLALLKSINTQGTWNGNVYTRNSVTFTVNTDGTITVNGTNNSSTVNAFMNYGEVSPSAFSFTGDVISGSVPNGKTVVSIRNGAPVYSALGESSNGNASTISAPAGGANIITYILLPAGQTANNEVIRPMICTLDEWKISPKFVPYRKSLDQLEATKAPVLSGSITSGDLNDVTINTFAMYANTVSSLPTSDNYYVETSVFDANSLIQRAYNIATAESYVRVKCVGTWSAWKQITNA